MICTAPSSAGWHGASASARGRARASSGSRPGPPAGTRARRAGEGVSQHDRVGELGDLQAAEFARCPYTGRMPHLEPVSAENWRAVTHVRVTEAQRRFVMDPAYYLVMCQYSPIGWSPLALRHGDDIVGFLIWAIDPADGSCWFGGVTIDQAWQGRGYGRRAVELAREKLHREHGHTRFALSYHPENTLAARTYAALGFAETGETEDDEVVARCQWPSASAGP